MIEAVCQILYESPKKQAKLEHLVEIINAGMVQSRGAPEVASGDEPAVQYLVRACLFFLSKRPRTEPFIKPAQYDNDEWVWARSSRVSRDEVLKLAPHLSRKLKSRSFRAQLNSREIAVVKGPSKRAKKIVSSEEASREYHKQEFQRYTNPYRPFRYMDAISGKTVVVAPLRKSNFAQNSKGRDHNVLTKERPVHVTVLALVIVLEDAW